MNSFTCNFLNILAVMSGLLFSGYANTQSLKKGQRVPPYTFTVMIGDSSFPASVSDYAGKHILIDFWRRDCQDCIAGMPKLLDLQKKLGDKLAILLVTTNTPSEIEGLFSKFRTNKKTRKWIDAAMQLPIVASDSFFTALFPYTSLPSQVWIREGLSYYGMAYPTSAVEENLRLWTSGEDISLDEVIIREIDPRDPSSLLGAAQDAPIRRNSYSMLLNRIEFGMGSYNWTTTITDSLNGREIGITSINASIPELYKLAYRHEMASGYSIPDYRIIWNIAEKTCLTAPPLNIETSKKSEYYSWARAYTFCYSLRMGPLLKPDLFSTMQADLDRWFGFKSCISKRKVKCRILKPIEGYSSRYTNRPKGSSDSAKYSESEKELIIQNLPFEQLYLGIQRIGERQRWQMPLLNEVPYTGNISIKIAAKESISGISVPELNRQLEKYGLILADEYRPMDMLVISDADKK